MTKKELNHLLFTLDIYKDQQIETDEQIDDDTHFVDSYSHTHEIITNELSESELKIALMAKQTELIKSIKGMVTFFTIITVIGIVSVFVLYLSQMG